jgi:uncharacterized membrane protein YkvA (DUF1232 family)
MPNRSLNSNALRQPSLWKLLLHLPKLIRLIGRLFKDSRVPLSGKLVFIFSCAYFLWPIDFISELIFPFVGVVDDVAILLFGLRFLLRQTPPNLLDEHLTQIG